MQDIDIQLLEKIVNEQLISSLGLVTPKGLPHCTPVWVHYHNGKLYIFSKQGRAKVRYAKANSQCMLAFNFGSVRGEIELFEKGSAIYSEVKDIPDDRYGHNSSLEGYKENWDIVFKITPTKLYR